MKKTRRFVALLLAAVLALALFTACGAAEQPQPQPTIGAEYEKWFVEDLKSYLEPDETIQKVECPEMRAALEKMGKDGKFKAKDGRYQNGLKESWMILSDPIVWKVPAEGIAKAVPLSPENIKKYGAESMIASMHWGQNSKYKYDIATRVIDGKTYAAVYFYIEKQ